MCLTSNSASIVDGVSESFTPQLPGTADAYLRDMAWMDTFISNHEY